MVRKFNSNVVNGTITSNSNNNRDMISNNSNNLYDNDDNNKGIQTKEDFFLNEVFRDVNKYATIMNVKKLKWNLLLIKNLSNLFKVMNDLIIAYINNNKIYLLKGLRKKLKFPLLLIGSQGSNLIFMFRMNKYNRIF